MSPPTIVSPEMRNRAAKVAAAIEHRAYTSATCPAATNLPKTRRRSRYRKDQDDEPDVPFPTALGGSSARNRRRSGGENKSGRKGSKDMARALRTRRRSDLRIVTSWHTQSNRTQVRDGAARNSAIPPGPVMPCVAQVAELALARTRPRIRRSLPENPNHNSKRSVFSLAGCVQQLLI